MKKYLFHVVIGGLAALASACGGGTSNVEYLPVRAEEGEKWGLINAKGEMLVSDEFSERPTCVVNGFFTVEENGGYAVYKADKKIHIVGDLEGLKDVGTMSEGRMPVTSKGERIRYVDEDGKTLFTLDPIDGKEIRKVCGFFSDGLAALENADGECGYINTSGKVVIPLKYSGAELFRDGYAIVSKTKDDNRTFYVINKKGEEVLKLKKDYSPAMSFVIDGTLMVENDDRFSLVDIKSGEYTKLPAKVKGVSYYDSKYIIFRDNGLYGIMDREMETLVRAKYADLSFNGKDTFIAKTEKGKVKIINSDDEELVALEDDGEYANVQQLLSYIIGFTTDFQLVNGRNKEVAFYDADGKKITKDTYDRLNFSFNESVYSDYFDADGAVAKLVSYIDGKKVGKVAINGAPASFLDGSADSHRSQDTYTIPGMEGGYRYNIEATAKDINTFFTTSESVPDGYWYRTVYRYNPASTVDEIKITLSTYPDGTYDKLVDAFKSKIKAKGWSLEKDDKAYQVYVNGDAHMLVTPNTSTGDGIKVYIYNAEYWPRRANSLIDEARTNYRNISQKYSSSEYTGDEYEVEEVVEAIADTTVVVESYY